MDLRFKNHYTRHEARALLPSVEAWIDKLITLRDELAKDDKRVAQMLGLGDDLGGPLINGYNRTIAAVKVVLGEFQKRDIQIKDIDRGLVDFPALIGGKEVFLCWEKGEDDIEFWHDIEAGYAGREKID